MASSNSDHHQLDLIQRYASYPFDSDAAFKKGLDDILSRSAVDADQNEIERKARLFYFNRINGSVLTPEDVDAVEKGASHVVGPSNEPEKTDPAVQGSTLLGTPDLNQNQGGNEEPVVLTLAQIKEFIETGRTDQLPNNKVIPGGLNEAAPTESVAPPRKKPWEVGP